MSFLNSPMLTTLLGFASYMLGLAILVQIFQEVYKYITSSKSKAYSKALKDFLGPWAIQLLRGNFGLITRGPFQWKWLRPKGILLPLDKKQLISGLEKTSPHWVNKTNTLLKQEAKYQGDIAKAPSSAWLELLQELGKAEKGASGYWNAFEIVEWLKQKDHELVKVKSDNTDVIGTITPPKTKTIKASDLLASFQEKFLPHIQEAEERFVQYQKNFEFTYKRRNLRQTFMIALIFSLFFQLNVSRIYRKAESMSPDEALALAESYVQLYEQLDKEKGLLLEEMEKKIEEMKVQLSKDFGTQTEQDSIKEIMVRWWEYVKSMAKSSIIALLRYLFECLVTTLLICFGAPLWNDIVSIFFRLQKGKARRQVIPEEENYA